MRQLPEKRGLEPRALASACSSRLRHHVCGIDARRVLARHDDQRDALLPAPRRGCRFAGIARARPGGRHGVSGSDWNNANRLSQGSQEEQWLPERGNYIDPCSSPAASGFGTQPPTAWRRRVEDALGRLQYRYFNWRQDTWSDLQLFVALNSLVLVTGAWLQVRQALVVASEPPPPRPPLAAAAACRCRSLPACRAPSSGIWTRACSRRPRAPLLWSQPGTICTSCWRWCLGERRRPPAGTPSAPATTCSTAPEAAPPLAAAEQGCRLHPQAPLCRPVR